MYIFGTKELLNWYLKQKEGKPSTVWHIDNVARDLI